MTGTIGAYRQSSIRIDAGNLTGTLEAGENSTIRLGSVSQSGHIDIFRGGVIRADGASLANAVNDAIGIGNLSMMRMNGGSVGTGANLLELYNFGILQTRPDSSGNPVDLKVQINNCSAQTKFSDGAPASTSFTLATCP